MEYINISTPPIATLEAAATATVTTTSGTDALLTGMQLVNPIAGTYLVLFDTVVQSASAGNTVTISIYVGGVQDANSVRSPSPFDGGTLSSTNASCGVSTHGTYTVNGAQNIEVQWHRAAGTASAFQRKLTAMKIG